MTRLSDRFAALRAQQRKALIPYISAGDPDPAQTAAILHGLVAGGADALELGILMGYLNSFERAGFAHVMSELSAAGGDAVILVDCPVEALPDYATDLQHSGITPILLVTPTTNPERRRAIVAHAGGFLYFVSLRGVTGTQQADADAIAADIRALKADTDLPVCIGFGIRDGVTARRMAALADGVVIGSALVARLHQAAESGQNLADTARAFTADIRAHLDQKD